MSSRSVQIIAVDHEGVRQNVLVDHDDNALIVMDETHSNIHRGIFFELSLIDLAVAADANMDILVSIPAGVEAHMRMEGEAGNSMQTYLYEAPTVSANGTQVFGVNRKRKLPVNAPEILTYSGPTVDTTGTELFHGLILATKQTVGSGGTFKEWYLAPSTLYLLRISNDITNSVTPAVMTLDWYEPDHSSL